MSNSFKIILFSGWLVGCDLIDYHPYDGRLDSGLPKRINTAQIARIEAACQEKDTLRFLFIGDTQRAYDEMEAFVSQANGRNDIDFVIHGGDYTEFGMTKEFEWAVERLNKLRVPYVGLIGNHDILGNGHEVYAELFGKENFSFQAGNVHFVCLNTNAIEYDHSHPVPDFGFLSEQIALADSTQRTLFVMHAPPGDDQFDNNVAEPFEYYLQRFPSPLCCLHAHTHTFSIQEPFQDGLIYYGCPNMGKRSYLLFTITPEDYSYEKVDF